jgi:hypothetical protein
MGAEDLRRKGIKMRKYAATLVGALALCGVASAAIIPSLPVVSTMLGVSTYSYTLTLSVGEEVVSGDDFCFADVLGLTGTPTAPTGWTATDQPSSACPHIAGVVNPNSAASVLYSYTGSTPITAAGSLGVFTFQSTITTEGTDNIAYGAFTDSPGNDTGPIEDVGDADGPESSTPEPASLGLMGGSLIGLGLLSRRLLRRAKN